MRVASNQLVVATLFVTAFLGACQRDGADAQGLPDSAFDAAIGVEDAASTDMADDAPDMCPPNSCGDCANPCVVIALGYDSGTLPITGSGAFPTKVVSESHGAARRDSSGGVQFFQDPHQRPGYILILQGCAEQSGPLPTIWKRVSWQGDGKGKIGVSLASGNIPVPGVTWGPTTLGTVASPADPMALGLTPNGPGSGAGYLELLFIWIPGSEQVVSSVLQSIQVSYECPEGGG